MKFVRLGLAAGLIVLGMYPLAARAESSDGVVFMPDGPPASTAKGRSPDRERDPDAWGISDAQWAKFQAIATASQHNLRVIVRLNNLRARQFKEDLKELLQSIPGWDVDDQGTYTAGTLASFNGILIQNRGALDPSPDALLIKQALDAAGIKPEAQFDATAPDVVRIVIGAPPMD